MQNETLTAPAVPGKALDWNSPIGPHPDHATPHKPKRIQRLVAPLEPVRAAPVTMPHNQDAERGVLGAILLDHEKVLPFCVEKTVSVKSFYTPIHQIIYDAMLEMEHKQKHVDVLTLSGLLEKQGKLKEIGGTAYLNHLLDAIPTAAHAEYYIDMVREHQTMRKIAKLGATIQDRANNSPKTSADVINDIRAELDSFDHTAGAMATIDAAEWAQETLPAPDQVLLGAFDLGTKCVLVAPSKARKSFFMLQAAISIAAGLKSFLSWEIPEPRRVCFWNLEITPSHFHARLLRMMRALDVTPADLADRLFVINSRGAADIGLSALAGPVKKHDIKVTFLDPFYKILPGDESDQEAVKSLLRGMDRLCTETGAAIVYSHHCGKGNSGDRLTIDRASGSGVLARDFDCQFSLTPHIDDGLAVVEQIARSYPPRDAFTIGWDDTRGCFDVRGDVVPVLQTSRNRNLSGRVGPALGDEDALATVSAKPLPSEMFKGALKTLGFTDQGGREVKARLLETGKLVMFKTKTFPTKTYIGTLEGIELLRKDYQNPKIEGLK